MNEILDPIARSCGVLVGTDAQGRFEHLGTAWCSAPGEWVTAWAGEEGPGPGVRLLLAQTGEALAIAGWEHDDDGIAGFTAPSLVPALALRTDKPLAKREPLWALGYPSMIDHPSFRLARGSLDAGRYYPYLCPWAIRGHLSLFASTEGWLTGRAYDGMTGAPVLDAANQVVGIVLGGDPAPEHPPLTRFRRLE